MLLTYGKNGASMSFRLKWLRVPQVVNGVELVLSQFCCKWCRACLEPVSCYPWFRAVVAWMVQRAGWQAPSHHHPKLNRREIEFVVDSVASIRMISRKDVNSAELETCDDFLVSDVSHNSQRRSADA